MELGVLGLVVTVVVAHLIALLSPGPDFILVVKSGIRNTTKNAIGVAFGIASANAIYIILCLIGVGAILASSIVVMTAIKILGGLFLTYIAFMALKSKRKDYEFINQSIDRGNPNQSSFLKEFNTGFLSGILNPKNPLFYLSLFSLVLDNNVSIWLKVGLGAWMTCLVFLWDAFIILVLSQEKVKSVFYKIAFYVDKLAGIILGLVGLQLLQSAVVQDK
jgi:threonine/homoserine/homoserine lactone efflux protein